MEKERTFFAPRKIRVVGCLNCPYFRDRHTMNFGEIVEEVKARCGHPSFKGNAPLEEEFVGNHLYIPDWCPLEFETYNTCAE